MLTRLTNALRPHRQFDKRMLIAFGAPFFLAFARLAGSTPLGLCALSAGHALGLPLLPLLAGGALGGLLCARPFAALGCALYGAALCLPLPNKVRQGALGVCALLCAPMGSGFPAFLAGAAVSVPAGLLLTRAPFAFGAALLGKSTHPRTGDDVLFCLGAGCFVCALGGLSVGAFRVPLALALLFACGCGRALGAARGALCGALFCTMATLCEGAFLPYIGLCALLGALYGAFCLLPRGAGAVCGFCCIGLFVFSGAESFAWGEAHFAVVVMLLLPESAFFHLAKLGALPALCVNSVQREAGCMIGHTVEKLAGLSRVFSDLAGAYERAPGETAGYESVCIGCEKQTECYEGMKSPKILAALATGVFDEEFAANCPRFAQLQQAAHYAAVGRTFSKNTARQLRCVAQSLQSVQRSAGQAAVSDERLAGRIRALLEDEGAQVYSVGALRTDDGVTVQLRCAPCAGERACEHLYTPIVSEAAGAAMQLTTLGCVCEGGLCTLTYVRAARLYALCGVARRSARGDCGDSYAFGRLPSGDYYAILSDGAGVGKAAAALSAQAVSLLENYLHAGMELPLAAQCVGSYLSTLCPAELFATLDAHVIDLQTGRLSFVKVGACRSYVLRGEKVHVLSGGGLPLGVEDTGAPKPGGGRLFAGDVLVLVSDGVAEYEKERDPDARMTRLLLAAPRLSPQGLCEHVLAACPETGDDMTILAFRLVESGN